MRLLKPLQLNDGDTIGVVAPSFPVRPVQKLYDRGIRNLRALGFKVKEGRTTKLSHMGYMAGADVERAEDINLMFEDREVKAIICAIGGQVAIRTLRYLNYNTIRANPKIFSGMSDITTFHTAFLAKTGLSGLNQTDIVFGFGADIKRREARYEINLFLRITKKVEPLGLLPKLTKWEVWREGKAEASLFGGNIPSMQALLGTPYFPRIDEPIIFFWECTVKPLDKIDQDLTQLRETGQTAARISDGSRYRRLAGRIIMWVSGNPCAYRLKDEENRGQRCERGRSIHWMTAAIPDIAPGIPLVAYWSCEDMNGGTK